MLTSNVDVIQLIAEFIDFTPKEFCTLARVSRTFYQAFTSDRHWEWFDIYGVKTGIYRHFIESITETDKELLHPDHFYNRETYKPTKASKRIPAITPNKYVWLELFRQGVTDVGEPGFVMRDYQFVRYAVRFRPRCFELLPKILLDDPEICFWALASPRADLGHHFQRHSKLADDKEFCKQVLGVETRARWRLRCFGWLWHTYSQLIFFSDRLCNDIDLIEMASVWAPSALLCAKDVTQQMIDRFAPTEDDFLPMIKNLGREIVPCFRFYHSSKVIWHAFADCNYEDDMGLGIEALSYETEQHPTRYSPETKKLVEVVTEADNLIDAPADLRADYYCVLTSLVCGDFSYSDHKSAIVAAIDTTVRHNKDFLYEIVVRFGADSQEAKLFPVHEVLGDPVYAQKLLKLGWKWYKKITAPVTKEIVKQVLEYDPMESRIWIPHYQRVHQGPGDDWDYVTDLRLPGYALVDREIVELAVGRFANVLDAPSNVLTRELREKHMAMDAKLKKLQEPEPPRKPLMSDEEFLKMEKKFQRMQRKHMGIWSEEDEGHESSDEDDQEMSDEGAPEVYEEDPDPAWRPANLFTIW